MGFGWTSPIKQAFQWAKSAVEEAVERAKEALGVTRVTPAVKAEVVAEEPAVFEAVTEAGLEVEPEEWAEAYQAAAAEVSQWETVQLYPKATVVPEYMFEEIPFDYKREFVTIAELDYYDPDLKEWRTQYVTVESDRVMPWEDWEMAIFDRFAEGRYTKPDVIPEIADITLRRRG